MTSQLGMTSQLVIYKAFLSPPTLNLKKKSCKSTILTHLAYIANGYKLSDLFIDKSLHKRGMGQRDVIRLPV